MLLSLERKLWEIRFSSLWFDAMWYGTEQRSVQAFKSRATNCGWRWRCAWFLCPQTQTTTTSAAEVAEVAEAAEAAAAASSLQQVQVTWPVSQPGGRVRNERWTSSQAMTPHMPLSLCVCG